VARLKRLETLKCAGLEKAGFSFGAFDSLKMLEET
jgi:hypothetical protein